ncbi:hypothetical protein ABPG74_007418 [Tetrahymena malaccensis]
MDYIIDSSFQENVSFRSNHQLHSFDYIIKNKKTQASPQTESIYLKAKYHKQDELEYTLDQPNYRNDEIQINYEDINKSQALQIEQKSSKFNVENSKKQQIYEYSSCSKIEEEQYDNYFMRMIFKRYKQKKNKWIQPIYLMFQFIILYLILPFYIIISCFMAQNVSQRNQIIENNKINYVIMKIILFITSSTLIMTIINYIILQVTQPVDQQQLIFLIGEHNRAFIYLFVVSLGFAILDVSTYNNHTVFLQIYKSLSKKNNNNILTSMKKLFISKSDFIFQFIQLKQEDPKKIQQSQRIKKVFIINKKSSNQQQSFSFYSGQDLCYKIIQYSQEKNLNKKFQLLMNILLTLIAHVKSLIPGIYRVIDNENFIIYNAYFTLIPYICVGNLFGMFSRNLINLQDLNFILDYNKALSALISYESYLGLKPKHLINTPSINLLDIKSIKTWQQMRLLLNQIKKKETMMIDKCTLFLFIYFIIVIFSVFIDKILKQSILITAGQQKVYKQANINDQYRIQYSLLQTLKNLIIKFYFQSQFFIQKNDELLIEKDIQWSFYSQLHYNYKLAINICRLNKIQNKNSQKHSKLSYQQQENGQIQNKNQLDDQYFRQLFTTIENIQQEIQLEILQTPMKFMVININIEMNVELTNNIKLKEYFEDLTVSQDQNIKNNSLDEIHDDQNLKNPFREIEILPKSVLSQRDTLQDKDIIIDLQKKKSSKNHEIYSKQNSVKSAAKSSQMPRSSQNSFNSKLNDDADKKFLKKLLKLDNQQNKKWYHYVLVAIKFAIIQLASPAVLIASIFKKQKKQLANKSFKQRCVLLSFQFYFLASSISLWIVIINFIYILSVKPMNYQESVDLVNDYNKVFMYFAIICVAFAILDSSIFKNSSLFYIIFQSLHIYSSTNIPKIMKQLFISEYAFIFQFFEYPYEEEDKVKQKLKVKKILLNQNDKKSFFFKTNQQQIYYSGLNLCQKIIQYAEKNNVFSKQFVVSQLALSLILYFKAFIPGIFRYAQNEGFTIYSTYLTVIPFLCVGNLASYFARTLNSLQDLNFIYDYNRALSALISYYPYLKIKPQYKINVPSINPVDLKSIKTWSQMRRLLNELKKEETIPIDRCTMFLFVYLILIFLAVFIGRFFKVVVFVNLISEKYLLPYFGLDVVLICALFCSRVYKQVKINNQFKEQYKLLQMVKNFLHKFFACREQFIEKEDIVYLDKDIQWFFYSQININYINCQYSLQSYQSSSDEIKSKNQEHDDQNKDKKNDYHSKNQLNQDQSQKNDYDFIYYSKLVGLIDNIQDELQLDILETPMKFLGLIPSTYGLLYTFISFIATFIYISFYLYLSE